MDYASMILSFVAFPIQIWLASYYYARWQSDKKKSSIIFAICWIIIAILNFVDYCYKCGVLFNG